MWESTAPPLSSAATVEAPKLDPAQSSTVTPASMCGGTTVEDPPFDPWRPRPPELCPPHGGFRHSWLPPSSPEEPLLAPLEPLTPRLKPPFPRVPQLARKPTRTPKAT